MVERAGAAADLALALAHVGIERAGIVLVESHQVHEPVVARGILQVRRRLAAVEPIARKVERRPRPFLEADHLGVETARGLEVVGADRVMVDAFDVHGPSFNRF